MNMKGIIIGAVVTTAAVAVYAVKKINDDRKTVELYSQDEATLVRKETFKEAAKRKVEEILAWVGQNEEKIDSAVKVATVVATVISVATSVVEFVTATRNAIDNPQEKMLEEIEGIRVHLVSESPVEF